MWSLVLIWAANFPIAKAALVDFSPLAFNAARYILASALMAVLVVRAGGLPRFTRREWWLLVVIGLLGNTAYQVFFILGLDATRAGNSSLILGTVPAYVALLSWRLGHERYGARTWVGVVLSLAGIALIVWGSAADVGFGGATLRGDLLTVAASMLWAGYTVFASPYVQRHGSLAVTAVAMWVGAAGLLLVSAPELAVQPWSVVRPGAWAALVYSGVFSIGVAYLLWYYSVRRIGTTRTALYSNTIPIVTLLIAWATIGEVPTVVQVIGGVAIVVGVTMARARRPRAPRGGA